MSGRETEREGPGEGRGRASSLLMSCTANSETGSPAAYANLHLTNLSHRSSTGSRITLDKDGNSPLPRAGLWAVGSGGVGGLSYVTKAQKRWAVGPMRQDTRSCVDTGPERGVPQLWAPRRTPHPSRLRCSSSGSWSAMQRPGPPCETGGRSPRERRGSSRGRRAGSSRPFE